MGGFRFAARSLAIEYSQEYPIKAPPHGGKAVVFFAAAQVVQLLARIVESKAQAADGRPDHDLACEACQLT